MSTPYHPTPLTVTKHQSMLTAESADQKVTRNSSRFKKLLADDSTAFSTSQPLGGETVDLDTENSSPSSISPGVYKLTSGPQWKCRNLCVEGTCICATKETHSRDLMIHSIKMTLHEHLHVLDKYPLC